MKRIVLCLVAITVIALTGCGLFHKHSPRHVAAVGTNGVAHAFNIGIHLDVELHNSKLIDDAEAKEYAKAFDEAATDNDEFIDAVRNIQIDANNKAQVLQLFEDFAGKATRNLKTFHVKNQEAQKRITDYFLTLQIALNGIYSFIEGAQPGTTGQQIMDGIGNAVGEAFASR